MKEVCKRCKKHKELAILKPRLCHDCAIAEDKAKDLQNKRNEWGTMLRMFVQKYLWVHESNREEWRNALLFFMRRLQAWMGNNKKIAN